MALATRLIVVHLFGYVFVAPLLGGFSVAFCKYLVETDRAFHVSLSASFMAGLATIIFYSAHGALVSAATLPFLLSPKRNLIANLCGAIAFAGWVTHEEDFVHGYEAPLFIVAGLFAFVMALFIQRMRIGRWGWIGRAPSDGASHFPE